MKKAEKGKQVKIHYTGTLDDGTVFDSSENREPLEFTVGGGMVIPGFDNAVLGMSEGEKQSVNIPCDQAYGPRQDQLVVQVPKTQFPEHINPEMGQQLQIQTGAGQPMMVTVTAVGDAEVTLDANHPLAGKDLNFELELVAVLD